VNELDRDRSLSHGGSDALDRSVPDVTGRKDTWDAGFERERPSFQRPFGREIVAGEQEPVGVSCDVRRQPLRLRTGADQDEQGVGRDRFVFAGCVFVQHELLQMAVSSPADHCRAGTDVDVWRGPDCSNQVIRHSSCE